eukprot:4554074-Prymnesium_polylepis.1
MSMLQADTDFAPDGDRTAFSAIGGQQQQGAGFCSNCDSYGHTIRTAAPSPRSTAASAATRGT